MKIAVGIPSFMESENIEFVTKQIDKGLSVLKCKYPVISECVIINIDSNSIDNTRGIFRKIKTQFPKKSINVRNFPGKGKNIIAFFQEVVNHGYDVALTLDSDLKSIEPDWISKFLKPFITGECDFVTPMYERKRFEGSTTNHFAYPLVYSFLGRDVRQPIAGDFAFSKGLVKYILKQKQTRNINRYGIDIFETIHALKYSKHIYKLKLDRKIHNPSFSKLEPMFPQVASSALDVIRSLDIKKLPDCEKQSKLIGVTDGVEFPHKDKADKLLSRQKKILLRDSAKIKWLGVMKKEIIDNINNKDFYYSKEIWSEVLSDWIVYAKDVKSKSSALLANQLLPYSVFRTVHFWNKIVDYSKDEVEKEIREQAKMVREKINYKLK